MRGLATKIITIPRFGEITIYTDLFGREHLFLRSANTILTVEVSEDADGHAVTSVTLCADDPYRVHWRDLHDPMRDACARDVSAALVTRWPDDMPALDEVALETVSDALGRQTEQREQQKDQRDEAQVRRQGLLGPRGLALWRGVRGLLRRA